MSIATEVGSPTMPKPDELEDAVLHAFDELDEPEEESPGRWHIDNAGSADWTIRHLIRARSALAKVNADADRQVAAINEAVAPFIEPIETWRAEQTEKLAKEAGNWEALLVEYHRQVLSEDKDAISIVRPHGTLKSRKLPDKWEFDEPAFIAWAAAHAPELVRVKEEIDKPLVKKVVMAKPDGTFGMAGVEGSAQGITVTVGDRRFEIETEELAQ